MSTAKTTVDTRIPLEWDSALEAWPFAMLDHDWAELQGMLKRSDDGYERIPAQHYEVERDAEGRHLLKWTGGSKSRPTRVYALVSVRPKPAGVFLGLPIPIVTPLIGAFTGLIIGLLPYLSQRPTDNSTEVVAAVGTEESPELGPEPLCAEPVSCADDPAWVAAEDLRVLTAKYDALTPYERRQTDEIEFIIKRSNDDRVLYLLGQSHGLRLEALRRLIPQESARKIALDVEENYVKQVLASDASGISFTRGQGRGQEDALRLLGLGDPKILTGEELGLHK